MTAVIAFAAGALVLLASLRLYADTIARPED
jgi:hypothetical protein